MSGVRLAMDVDDEASDSQLTWKQGVEHFQNAFNNSVKCYGSSKNKPKELYVADMLHNNGITRLADTDAILTLIGKMQRFSAFKERTMQFMSFPTPESKMKRKMSFLAWQPVTGLVSTLPRGKRDDLIITPTTKVIQETKEKESDDNGVMEVEETVVASGNINTSVLIEVALSEDNNILNESHVSALTEENEDPPSIENNHDGEQNVQETNNTMSKCKGITTYISLKDVGLGHLSEDQYDDQEKIRMEIGWEELETIIRISNNAISTINGKTYSTL